MPPKLPIPAAAAAAVARATRASARHVKREPSSELSSPPTSDDEVTSKYFRVKREPQPPPPAVKREATREVSVGRRRPRVKDEPVEVKTEPEEVGGEVERRVKTEPGAWRTVERRVKTEPVTEEEGVWGEEEETQVKRESLSSEAEVKEEPGSPAAEIKAEPSPAPPAAAAAVKDEPSSPAAAAVASPSPSIKAEPAGSPAAAEPAAAPPNWRRTYALTKQMRRRNPPAPVDTLGCATLADVTTPPPVQRFQTLVSLLLSSQTKDATTAAAVRALQTSLPGGLTVASVLATPPATLNALIAQVGFHRRKTDYLLRTAQVLREEYNDDIPKTVEGLLTLPGVGPKMAHLAMEAAWKETTGVGVDTHVHRILNRWGWVHANTPEGSRAQVEAWLPREYWGELNKLLVGFGQTVCLPRGRKCGECLLSNGLCPSAFTGDGVGKRRRVKQEEEEGAGTGRRRRVKVEVKSEDEEEEEVMGGEDDEYRVKEEVKVEEGRVATRRQPKRTGRVKIEAKTEDGWERMPDIEDAV